MNRKRAMLVAGRGRDASSLALPLAACTSARSRPSRPVAGAGRRAACTAPRGGRDDRHRTRQGQQELQHPVHPGRDRRRVLHHHAVRHAQAEAAKLGVTVNTQGPQKFDPTLQKPILDSVVAAEAGRDPDRADRRHGHAAARSQAAAARASRSCWSTPRPKDPSYRRLRDRLATTRVAARRPSTRSSNCTPRAARSWSCPSIPASRPPTPRAKGFEEAVKADRKFTYVGVQYSHNDPATAAQLIGAAAAEGPRHRRRLRRQPVLRRGLRDRRAQAGKSGQVKIVGFDAGPNQVKALKEGTVQALVAQEPGIIGKYGVDEAVTALDGGQNTKKVQTGFTDHHAGQRQRRRRCGRVQVELLAAAFDVETAAIEADAAHVGNGERHGRGGHCGANADDGDDARATRCLHTGGRVLEYRATCGGQLQSLRGEPGRDPGRVSRSRRPHW